MAAVNVNAGGGKAAGQEAKPRKLLFRNLSKSVDFEIPCHFKVLSRSYPPTWLTKGTSW